MPYDPHAQFKRSREELLANLDFLNWHRYFFILKELVRLAPKRVLEIGPGEGTLKRVYEPFAGEYATMDVNARLTPTFQGDVRNHLKEAEGRFDAVVAADILEHIPFGDVPRALRNINSYLARDGHGLITIPHRAWFVFGLTWLWNYRPFLWRFPEGTRKLYHRLRGRKTLPIDPEHQWEIGDGRHTAKDVERLMREAGFVVESRRALLYVDFWVLRKQ